jgi:hypothetical protein
MAAQKPDDDNLPYLVDKDGHPLNLFGERISDDHYAVTLQRQYERDMQAAQKRWERGDLTAFPHAVWLYWRQHPKLFPRWMVEASEAQAEHAMAEGEKRARREFNIARTRWEALVELRERRHELNQLGDDRGMVMEDAREAVSEVLQKDEAAGGAAAVKESYELMQDAGGERATFQSFLEARHRRHVRRQERRRRNGSPG